MKPFVIRFWPWRNFRYVEGDPFSHANRAAYDWVVEQCSADLKRPEGIAFIYGIATVSQVESGTRVIFESKSGGFDYFTLELLAYMAANLRELKKKNPRMGEGSPWRKRLVLWLLLRLA